MERFYHLMKDKADCYVLTASYKEEDASGEEAVMHDESSTHTRVGKAVWIRTV